MPKSIDLFTTPKSYNIIFNLTFAEIENIEADTEENAIKKAIEQLKTEIHNYIPDYRDMAVIEVLPNY